MKTLIFVPWLRKLSWGFDSRQWERELFDNCFA